MIYPPALRDVLITVALKGLYQARWSEEILDEVKRNLAMRINPAEAEARVSILRQLLPDAMVADYAEELTDLENYPKDHHVVAAALKGGAKIIVTGNLKHFHPVPTGLRAMLPDAFLCQFLNRTDDLLEALEDVREGWPVPPPLGVLLDRLDKLVPQFASVLRATV